MFLPGGRRARAAEEVITASESDCPGSGARVEVRVMSPEKNVSSAWSRSLTVRLAAALAVLAAGLVAAAHFTGGAPRSAAAHLTASSLPHPAAAAAPAFFGTRPPGAKLPSSA